MTRRYILIATKSLQCGACLRMESQGFFQQLETLKSQGTIDDVYVYTFSTLGPASDQAQLFNMNLWFPNFKLMPEDVYHAANNGVNLANLIDQVRFYNAVYDPSEPLIGMRATHDYPEIPTIQSMNKFCNDAIISLEQQLGAMVPEPVQSQSQGAQYHYWYHQR